MPAISCNQRDMGNEGRAGVVKDGKDRDEDEQVDVW